MSVPPGVSVFDASGLLVAAGPDGGVAEPWAPAAVSALRFWRLLFQTPEGKAPDAIYAQIRTSQGRRAPMRGRGRAAAAAVGARARAAGGGGEGVVKLQNPRLFFDVAIGGGAVGRMTFEVYADKLPLTAENFRALCTGELGQGYWRRPKCYEWTSFHRIIPGFMCQGGDFNCDNGYGGESIYGQFFRDENFFYRHSKRGLLSMAGRPRGDCNNSIFFITFDACPWLDGKHVVFGHLESGESTLSRIEAQGTECGKPRRRVEIAACGELTPSRVRLLGEQALYERPTRAELARRPARMRHALEFDPPPMPKSMWSPHLKKLDH